MNWTLIWLAVFLGTLVIEFITPMNLITIWFSFGALGALIVSFLSSNIILQWICFILLSLASFFMMRPVAKKLLQGETIATNSDRLIHTRFILEEDLLPNKVMIHPVGQEQWSIKHMGNTLLAKGSLVEVISIDGVKLIIKEIKTN